MMDVSRVGSLEKSSHWHPKERWIQMALMGFFSDAFTVPNLPNQVQTTLTVVEEERDRFMTKLLNEEKARKSLEGQMAPLPSLNLLLPSCSSSTNNVNVISPQNNTRSWSMHWPLSNGREATLKTSWRSCSRKTRSWSKCTSRRKTLCSSKRRWNGLQNICGSLFILTTCVRTLRSQEAHQGRAGAAQQGEHALWGGRKSAWGWRAGESPAPAHRWDGGADEEDRGGLQRAGLSRFNAVWAFL